MKKIGTLFTIILLISCGSGDDPAPVDPENNIPTASSYIAPTNNAVCTGEEISDSEIVVDFQWNPFQDVEDDVLNYTFTLRNLATNLVVTTENPMETNTSVTLEKGTSYAWTVAATDSEGDSVTGAIWQFQTPFNAIANYLPFPATLLSPNNGATVTTADVVFTWQGNDPDEGETALLEYTVYVDTVNPPVQEVAAMITAETHTETLTPGVYYWKIESRDLVGNISNSEIRQFIIE
ncbi:hypothetical protein KORDIASMS9_04552 [Kordia sp. SMS9]|uniref:hypothetical protein n=1 Tax=Kordia sp. SMS9 TaxID=2282170 RepID=UPI000E0DE82C|nr:hypothetical protein [Kordia sp. SMS9]AXG72283.1 hypothetical protein KORDIASMS9_04552 [Kordia sp. SMS9]